MPSTATTFARDRANATAPAGAIEQAIAAAGTAALTPTADSPDADLILMAQSGNTRAFDVLVKRYRGRVYLLAYHQTKSHEDALDITQEAFIRPTSSATQAARRKKANSPASSTKPSKRCPQGSARCSSYTTTAGCR
jgi:hypothetical protein